MKTNSLKSAVVILSLLFCLYRGHCQGSFRDLDFESATIVRDPSSIYYPYAVVASNAIPGWTGYVGGVPQSDVLYNTVSGAAAAISLQGPGSQYRALQGNYSVGLQGEYNPAGTPGFTNDAAIAQTGQVPENTKALLFLTLPYDVLQVTFSGQPLPLLQVRAFADYVMVGADMTAFAGQTGELRFRAPLNGGCLLDGIRFSDQSIPEPSASGLFAVGVLLLSWLRLRKQPRKEFDDQSKRGCSAHSRCSLSFRSSAKAHSGIWIWNPRQSRTCAFIR